MADTNDDETDDEDIENNPQRLPWIINRSVGDSLLIVDCLKRTVGELRPGAAHMVVWMINALRRLANTYQPNAWLDDIATHAITMLNHPDDHAILMAISDDLQARSKEPGNFVSRSDLITILTGVLQSWIYTTNDGTERLAISNELWNRIIQVVDAVMGKHYREVNRIGLRSP